MTYIAAYSAAAKMAAALVPTPLPAPAPSSLTPPVGDSTPQTHAFASLSS